jgi:hypothetical protein
MEEILHLYQLPYDPLRPLWCFDERPCQLLGDTLVPLPMQAGKLLRQNYEYERNGTCSILFAVQPHTGRCFAQVRHQRTAHDYAEFMQALSQAHCPPGGQIVLVQDNLNTHTPASFYVAFTPEIAFALKQTFEVHYTPKKASWLNMAEIELSVLAKQCLDRRIPCFEQIESQVLAWIQRRNQKPVPIRWQFTPEIARTKFKRFYPNPSKLV